MSNQVYANKMEVSCKSASGKTICATPDVCFTPPLTPATPPGVPIPYPNTGMASDTTDGSTSVNISGKEVMLKNKSCFSKSSGDEAGSAPKKGVVTSKNMGKVYFGMWSMDVKIEGENAVRHLDITTHNHAAAMPGNSPPMPHTDEMAAGGGGDEAAQSCPIGPAAGSPVNPILGAKVLAGDEDLDFELDGPLPLKWQRNYLSSNVEVGWFGPGWGSPLEVRLEAIPNAGGDRVEYIEYVCAFGRRVRFPLLDKGTEFDAVSEQLTLLRALDGQFSVLTREGVAYRFHDRSGAHYRLAAVVDRNDNAIRVEYGQPVGDRAVIDVYCSGGQHLELAFVRSRLVDISELRRGASGDLRVTLMHYEYNGAGGLSRVINRANETMRRFEYTPDGRMAHQVFAEVFEAWYEYAGVGAMAKVVKHWDNVGRSWVFRHHDDHTLVTDQDGRTTRFYFDGKKRWIGYQDAAGQFTARGFDKHGNLCAVVDPAENATQTTFDDRGNAVEVRDATGAVTQIEWHPTQALPVSVTDPLNRTTYYAYDGRGNRILEVLPGGEETAYELDERGLVKSITDVNGGTRRLRHNARGQLTHHVDCSGKTTTFDYDDNGWLRSVTDALGQRATYQYDAAGRLARHTLADESFEAYEHDAAGRLLVVSNALSAKTQYRYAPDGLLTERIDPRGHSILYNYDRSRRLIEIVNENGARYRFAYDAGGRLVEEIRFDGVRTCCEYDAAGHLVRSIEAADSPEAITTEYRRDAVGRLLERVTAHGVVTAEYDDAGQLTQVRNAKVAVTRGYDSAGRVVEECVRTPARFYALRHAYDALGNRLETTLPDGKKINVLHYGSGHVHQIRIHDVTITDFERDALHREVVRTQGRLTTQRGYDGAGRQTRQYAMWTSASRQIGEAGLLPGIAMNREYSYDAAGRLALSVDGSRRMIYEYDLDDGLRRFDQERFAFDPAHNLVGVKAPTGGSAGMVRDNRLMVFEDKRYRYDAHGRVVEKRIGAHTVVEFAWDDEHRLVGSSTRSGSGSSSTEYLYDPFGRRIAKKSVETGATIWFVWDGDRLLQQFDDTDEQTFIYEPDSFAPLARASCEPGSIKEAPRIHYYHCDQIGTPVAVTDAEGSVAWEGSYAGWGRLREERVRASAARGPGSEAAGLVQPLRYQGQYCDAETGLHYSRYRYYDPDIARFVSPDPIGLMGGENLYAYAINPTGWIDPTGLAAFNPTPNPKKPNRTKRDNATCNKWAVERCDRECKGHVRGVGHVSVCRDPKDGLWYSADQTGHGGSEWKVFKERGTTLSWVADLDKFGDIMGGKHKGSTGMTIPLDDLACKDV